MVLGARFAAAAAFWAMQRAGREAVCCGLVTPHLC